MHVIWPCFKLQKTIRLVAAAGGTHAVRQYLDHLAIEDPALAEEWAEFRVAADIRSLSVRSEPEYHEARMIPADDDAADDEAARRERATILREAINELRPRDAVCFRLRYGLDGPAYTLEEIGRRYGVTRERVRQRVVRAQEKLRFRLLRLIERRESSNGEEVQEAQDQAEGKQ